MKKALLAVLIMVFLSALAAARTPEEMKEQGRTCASYYKAAMESFYQGDYSIAIKQWEEILKIDPQQTQAQNLIEFARQKMADKLKPMSGEIDSLMQQGKYAAAFGKNQERLAMDASNEKWKRLGARLDKVSKIFPENTDNDKTSVLARRGVYAYLCEPDDPRFSLNACRYASQLKPDNPRLKGLRDLMEEEYQALAQGERIISGSNLVDQKLQAMLSNIYDGKYDRAILDSNDVLALEPNNVVAMKRAGSAYYASGNKKQAVEMWQRAARVAPNDPELKKFLKVKK
jgi:tetratricopeptide (TPR) repeat protein